MPLRQLAFLRKHAIKFQNNEQPEGKRHMRHFQQKINEFTRLQGARTVSHLSLQSARAQSILMDFIRFIGVYKLSFPKLTFSYLFHTTV